MKTKKITLLGIAITLAMIMSYIESLFPLSFAVPGIKMGLANIVIIFVLYKMSTLDAIIVSIIRVLLVSLLFGNVMTLTYSISGAVLSLLTYEAGLLIKKKCKNMVLIYSPFLVIW